MWIAWHPSADLDETHNEDPLIPKSPSTTLGLRLILLIHRYLHVCLHLLFFILNFLLYNYIV